MKKLKLSPSKIEKFRLYNEGEYNDSIKKEDLIDSITGDSEWTAKAEFGTAFHAVMRFGADKYRTDDFLGWQRTEIEDVPVKGDFVGNVNFITYKKEGIMGVPDETDRIYRVQDEDMPHALEFVYEDIRLADEYNKANPGLSWEVWDTYIYILDGEYEILMRMRYDALLGNWVKEHKTTSNTTADHDFFARSCQWRIYLISTGAERTVYERFMVREYADGRRNVTQNTFTFFPHEDMKEYVDKNARGLIHFCANNVDKNGDSLMKYITR